MSANFRENKLTCKFGSRLASFASGGQSGLLKHKSSSKVRFFEISAFANKVFWCKRASSSSNSLGNLKNGFFCFFNIKRFVPFFARFLVRSGDSNLFSSAAWVSSSSLVDCEFPSSSMESFDSLTFFWAWVIGNFGFTQKNSYKVLLDFGVAPTRIHNHTGALISGLLRTTSSQVWQRIAPLRVLKQTLW